MDSRHSYRSHVSIMSRQRGVVLLFSLIALAVMLIAAVALIRSFNSSLFTAGNIAFKRDMQNQSERAAQQALTEFRLNGALNTSTQRAASLPAHNYSAQILATNAQGIPNALVASNFSSTYTAACCTSGDSAQSIQVRYIIDRMCTTAGNETTLAAGVCHLANSQMPKGTSASNQQGADRAPLCATCSSAAPQGVVYRLSVMVLGPRNTQSFFQSTFTVPSSS